MTSQHRFVASLVMMSLVVFILTLATRNLAPPPEEEEELVLTELILPVPSPEAVGEVELLSEQDLAPLEDPMNRSVSAAVGLASICLEDVTLSYYLPVHVLLGEEGVMKARVEALPVDVAGRLECLSASLYANPWPEVRGIPKWIKFRVPPTG